MKVGDQTIVEEINLLVHKSELIVLVGKNGSGKSTLLKYIATLIRPESNSIFVNGQDVTQMSPVDRAQVLTLLPQHTDINENLLVNNYIELCSYAYNFEICKDLQQEYIELLEMQNLMFKKMSHLSGGELKKVSMLGCLMQSPKLLLLDEPFQNLDPHVKNLFFRLIKKLKEKDVAILMVTHDFMWGLPLADKLLAINKQKLLAGSGESFLADVFNHPFQSSENNLIIPLIKVSND